MTTERIDIVVREDGSRIVRRNLEDIGSGARAGASGVDQMRNSLNMVKSLVLSMGLGYGVSEIVKYIDTWANLEGRLKLVTDSYSQLKRVQNDLFEVSQRTRSAYEGTADLYARIARSTKELNASDRDRIKVTEGINKAIVISGSSAESAKAAIIQLGQGFASGTLRGEELNSVLEQTPRVAEAIADGMGKTVGQLRAMGAAGLLTSKAVFEALHSQADVLQREFAQMPLTIGQSFTILKNELLRFVGQTGEANNVAGAFAEVLGMVGRNLDTLASVLGGFLAFKLAEFFINSTVAIYSKIAAMRQYAVQLQADRIFEIASAEATLAAASASVAKATADRASLVVIQERVVAQLRAANADIVAARASIAAATAAGAQSFALRTLRIATAELAVAETMRNALIAESAALDRVKITTSAALTAATTAEAAATTALAGARGAATGAGALAARALGALGGPIGLITLALGLGATAWMMWGNKAKEQETQVEQTLSEKTQEIISSLDKRIEKLKEWNRLAGINPELAKAESPVADQQRALAAKMNKVATDPTLNVGMRTELLRTLGAEYAELSKKLDIATKEQTKQDAVMAGDKLKTWWNKNEQYLTDAEKLTRALTAARKELGVTELPKDVEAKITGFYSKKDAAADKKDAMLQYKEELAVLEMQQKLQKEIADGKLRHAQALHAAGGMSETKLIDTQRQTQLDENTRMQEFVRKQIDLAKGAGQEQVAARAKYQGELAILGQQRLNIEQAASDQLAGMYANRERRALDASNAELTSINAEVANIQNKIRFYDMLPAAITRATIAELEAQKAVLTGDFADQVKIASINAKIEALNRLAGVQSQAEKFGFDADQARNVGNEWKRVADTIGNALTTAFSKGGSALGKMVQGYGAFKKAEVDIRRQYDERVKVADGDAKRIKEAEIRYAYESAEARMGAYAEMSSAAKGFFDENSKGYQVLEAAEKAFRLMEIANAAKSFMVQSSYIMGLLGVKLTANTTAEAIDNAFTLKSIAKAGMRAAADGIAAIAKAISSVPYPMNLVAGATTAAALVAFGVKLFGGGGGGGTSAEERQKAQGTGTVFGMKDAKSESISRSIELLSSNSNIELTYTQGMLRALLSIESSMGGLGNLLIRGSGVTGDVGPDEYDSLAKWSAKLDGAGGLLGSWAKKISNKIFGGKVSVQDTGVTATKGTLSSIMSGNGITSSQYLDTKKDGGWFRSDKYNTELKGLGSEADAQFNKIIINMADAVKEAGLLLGQNGDAFNQRLAAFVVDIGKISLKDLTGEEIQAELEAVFSKVGDDMARWAVGGLASFQRVGEGYLETLVRIASNYANIDSVLQSINMTFGATGMSSIAAREDMLSLMGGIDEFASKASSFADNYMTEAERLKPVQDYVIAQMGKLGLAHIDNVDEFKNHVLSLKLVNQAEREQYAALMDLESAFAKVYAGTKLVTKSQSEILDERKELLDKLDELAMTELQLMEKRRNEYDVSNRLLFDQVRAVEKVREANEATMEGLEGVIDRMQTFRNSLKDLRTTLTNGELSTLTPEQKYAALRAQYTETKTLASAGDEKAQAAFSGVAQEFLALSQKINGGDSQYMSDYARVMGDIEALDVWSAKQVDVAKESLGILKLQLISTQELNETMRQVAIQLGLVTTPDGIVQGGTGGHSPAGAVDYSKMGSMDMAPVAAKFDQLNGEIAAMRVELKEQTEATLKGFAESALVAATTVAEGFKESTIQRDWSARPKGELKR